MDYIIDQKPPPDDVNLKGLIRGLQAGQSLSTPSTSIRVLRVTVSRVKTEFPDRTFTTREDTDGPRVWRLT